MLIFDLHNLAWRAFHTTGGLKYGSDPTGVIFGVLREIQGTIRLFQDPLVVIAGDSKNNCRKKIFPGYKKKDKPFTLEEEEAYKETIQQINTLKHEIFPVIGLRNVFEYDGFEADDIMAEIVLRKDRWTKPIIVTGDEDLFQVLNRARIWLPNKKKMMNENRFIEQYGIPPQLWWEVKALAGCTSDKVPGVAGIGQVYALSHLQGKLKGKRLQAIQEAEASGHLDLMRKLVRLPFPDTPESVLRPIRFDKKGFLCICDKYGLESLEADVEIWEELFQRRER